MKKTNMAVAIILTAIIAAGIGFIAGAICEWAVCQKTYDYVIEMAEEDMDRAIEETLNRLYEE